MKTITQPTLVVNGRRDIMVPTINSYHLTQHIPTAQLIVYPDSGHASRFQYSELLVSQVELFLDAVVPFAEGDLDGFRLCWQSVPAD